MSNTPRQQWPMPEYLQAWKLFREKSDENEATAKFLISCPSWPHKSNLEICDLGCGDGRLLAELLAFYGNVQKVRLVDPDNDLLNEAESLIEGRFAGKHIIALLKSVREDWPKCAGDADVILGVHLVYLLEEDELQSLVKNRPRKATTYIVFDSPNSVFTELWQWTADKYFRRAKRAHEVIQEHLGLKKIPQANLIRSKIPKSLFCGHKLANWLLSILCYRNMLDEVPDELRSKVREILDRHTDSTGQFVECESVCYEFPPSGFSAAATKPK
jgi:SAM-dependent methyltransferase